MTSSSFSSAFASSTPQLCQKASKERMKPPAQTRADQYAELRGNVPAETLAALIRAMIRAESSPNCSEVPRGPRGGPCGHRCVCFRQEKKPIPRDDLHSALLLPLFGSPASSDSELAVRPALKPTLSTLLPPSRSSSETQSVSSPSVLGAIMRDALAEVDISPPFPHEQPLKKTETGKKGNAKLGLRSRLRVPCRYVTVEEKVKEMEKKNSRTQKGISRSC
jgi:hypothetical protein